MWERMKNHFNRTFFLLMNDCATIFFPFNQKIMIIIIHDCSNFYKDYFSSNRSPRGPQHCWGPSWSNWFILPLILLFPPLLSPVWPSASRCAFFGQDFSFWNPPFFECSRSNSYSCIVYKEFSGRILFRQQANIYKTERIRLKSPWLFVGAHFNPLKIIIGFIVRFLTKHFNEIMEKSCKDKWFINYI